MPHDFLRLQPCLCICSPACASALHAVVTGGAWLRGKLMRCPQAGSCPSHIARQEQAAALYVAGPVTQPASPFTQPALPVVHHEILGAPPKLGLVRRHASSQLLQQWGPGIERSCGAVGARIQRRCDGDTRLTFCFSFAPLPLPTKQARPGKPRTHAIAATGPPTCARTLKHPSIAGRSEVGLKDLPDGGAH